MVRLTIEQSVSAHSPGRLLRAVNRRMTAFAEVQFANADLSFIQWVALKCLHDGTARTAGELARELKMTSGALTRLVDVLETRGFLKRDRRRADRRVIQLELTPSGAATVVALAAPLTDAWNEVLADFEDAEFRNLTMGLRKLLAALEASGAG